MSEMKQKEVRFSFSHTSLCREGTGGDTAKNQGTSVIRGVLLTPERSTAGVEGADEKEKINDAISRCHSIMGEESQGGINNRNVEGGRFEDVKKVTISRLSLIQGDDSQIDDGGSSPHISHISLSCRCRCAEVKVKGDYAGTVRPSPFTPPPTSAAAVPTGAASIGEVVNVQLEERKCRLCDIEVAILPKKGESDVTIRSVVAVMKSKARNAEEEERESASVEEEEGINTMEVLEKVRKIAAAVEVPSGVKALLEGKEPPPNDAFASVLKAMVKDGGKKAKPAPSTAGQKGGAGSMQNIAALASLAGLPPSTMKGEGGLEKLKGILASTSSTLLPAQASPPRIGRGELQRGADGEVEINANVRNASKVNLDNLLESHFARLEERLQSKMDEMEARMEKKLDKMFALISDRLEGIARREEGGGK
mmetsp:Transcript_18008/g.44701  ORF Transcript_18008/g.44701 Transcript_18008/m.44701 type:complete len:423 (-) Transcript_18008:380-1648(-)